MSTQQRHSVTCLISHPTEATLSFSACIAPLDSLSLNPRPFPFSHNSEHTPNLAQKGTPSSLDFKVTKVSLHLKLSFLFQL